MTGRPDERRGDLRLERVASLESLKEEWAALAAGSRNIFLAWEWISIWWRHFGRGRRLLTVACRSSDETLVAVLPLYLSTSRPLKIVRFLGNGPGDELGPVCAPDDREQVARALPRAFLDWHCDVFLGDQLSGDAAWGARLGATTLRREASPVLPIGGRTWEDFVASVSANLREQVGRRERKLARDHGRIQYRMTDEAAELDRDLDTFFALHGARWGDRSPVIRHQAFHREFARCAFEHGWLRLWFLEVDNRPVATWYGFRFSGVESYYQAGWNPRWQHSSVGFVLLVHSIREAFRDGMGEYRFLRGGESYKYRFADEDRGLESIALGCTSRGRAAVALAVRGRRVPLLRAVVRRLRATV